MTARGLSVNLCMGVAARLKAATQFSAQYCIYHQCIDTIELTTAQTLILSLFHCLLNGDFATIHTLLPIIPYLPQLRSSFIGVWLRDDYTFHQKDVAKVLSTLAKLVKEGNVMVPLPVIIAFSGLEEKYDVFSFLRKSGDTTAQHMLACLNPLVTRATQVGPEGFKNQETEARVYTESISTQTESQYKEVPMIGIAGNSAQSLIEEYLDSERMEDNINIPDIEGNLPIHRAAMDGRTDVVQALLQQGARPNDTNSFKMTPLQMAISSCRTDTIIFLLSHGASLQSKDIMGRTALHHAAHYGDPDVIRLLLSHRVNKEAKDAAGNRPLHFASKFGHTQAVRLLINAGANRQIIIARIVSTMVRICMLIALSVSVCCTGVELETKKGIIRGSEGTSRNGRSYRQYMAVPYARPPIDKLRFRNPQMHDGWEGVLDASKEPLPCIQKISFSTLKQNSTIGKEDCLYLNIYTPSEPENDEKLPVMVYIHGGGFRWGSPGSKNSEKFFMDEDIVLVTVQYRLGTLGFLSTEDSLIPGNFGLKDQAMALKWVKENIDEYGGNPDLIVAFGESAGGASVHYLLTSPLSRDIIKGGISQSGVLDAPWALSPPGRARKYAMHVADMVGCGKDPLLECFQSLPAEQLAATDAEFTTWDFDPVVVFQPVIEVKNNGAFMKEDPRTIEVTLPWVTGITNGEGNLKSAALINQDPSVLDYFIENIDKVLATILYIDPKTPMADQLLNMVKNRYFQNLTDKKHILKEHEKLFFDLYFAYPMKKALERHTGPKYAYFLSHRPEHSITDMFGPIKLNSSKACHGDDTTSLFDKSASFPSSKEKPEDKQFSERLVKMWVDFARSLKSSDQSFNKQWKPYLNNNFLHLKTYEFIMEQISLDYLLEFWSKAYSLIKHVEKDEL
ncbi:unnamed protein product [Nezara viridula]|uniref:Carboxylesterase type B domain-containing protein n=1 Tax=Nezara viridula TaxID=85310 RepID=A0A9P0E8Z7_NEZVI|nr:unnamed protein product [Nezara viridula]